MVYFIGSAGIDVERNTHLLHALFDDRVVAVDHLLGRDAFFHGPDGDGHPVFVAAADEFHVFFLCPQVAHVNIGG